MKKKAEIYCNVEVWDFKKSNLHDNIIYFRNYGTPKENNFHNLMSRIRLYEDEPSGLISIETTKDDPDFPKIECGDHEKLALSLAYYSKEYGTICFYDDYSDIAKLRRWGYHFDGYGKAFKIYFPRPIFTTNIITEKSKTTDFPYKVNIYQTLRIIKSKISAFIKDMSETYNSSYMQVDDCGLVTLKCNYSRPYGHQKLALFLAPYVESGHIYYAGNELAIKENETWGYWYDGRGNVYELEFPKPEKTDIEIKHKEQLLLGGQEVT